MPSSLDYIHSGTAEQFIDALTEEVFQHPAVHHPYLERLSNGRLPNVDAALRDYAHHYRAYSSGFVGYLDAVIGKLENPEHREVILENLEEEQGDPTSNKLEERPHVEIFADFARRVGADEEFAASNSPCDTALIWRDLFDQKCKSEIAGVGLGAMGLATEYIVPTVYPYFVKAIDEHSSFDAETSLFFRLHVECDDGHGEDIARVTKEVAEDVTQRESIRFGTLSALNLRAAFWDAMLSRAMAMHPA